MKTIQLLRLISIINSLLIIPACSAQNPSETLLEDILEDLSVNNDTDNSVNTPNWENELEELSNRMQEPVNLNVATREQLEQFPFLSDIQHPNKQKPIRGERLGTNYTKSEVIKKIGEQNNGVKSSAYNGDRKSVV